MTDKRITRRRVVQGAGAIGIAGVFGSSIVAAQQNETTQDGQSAAVRVVHASPDAPSIDVQIDGESPIEGLEFGTVSSYTEVEPGSRQVTVVATEEGLLGGLFDDIVGGGQEGTALFDQQIEVEQGTTYTLVAFGEVASGPAAGDGSPAGNETGGFADNETGGIAQNETGAVGQNETGGFNDTESDGVGQNETGGMGTEAGGEVVVEDLPFGEHETFEVEEGDYTFLFRETMDGASVGVETDDPAGDTQTGGQNDTGGFAENETDGFDDNETGSVGGTEPGSTAGSERAFQVEVLEDDLSDPGEGRVRMRVFHAVPDVRSMSVTAVSQEELTNQTGNDTGGGPSTNDTDGGLGGNDTGDGFGANQTEGSPGETGDNVRETDVSLAGSTVYSGFATGYFDPEAAADSQTEDNETGDNQTGGSDDVVQDASGAEFEFVTVEDALDGERSDEGTGGPL